jgi:hypothetical protein
VLLRATVFSVQLARVVAAGGRVDAATGRINGNLNVSRAVGDLRDKQQTRLGAHQQLVRY